MVDLLNLEKTEHLNLEETNPPKYNKIWGNEFMLMDSSTFMGGSDGSEYENVIEMFVNIWNVNQNQLAAS